MHPIMSTACESFSIDNTIPIYTAGILHKLCATGGCAGGRTEKSECKQTCNNDSNLFHSTAFVKMLRK